MAHKESEGAQGRGWSGLTLTTAAFLFLLLRLFAVSGYQWHTAFAVLHTLDLEDSIGIVLGTVMADSTVAAVLLAVLLPAFLFRVVGGFLLALRLRQDALDEVTAEKVAAARGRTGREPSEGAPGTGPVDLAGLGMLAIVVAGCTAYVSSFHTWWPLVAAVGVTLATGALGYATRRRPDQVGEASRWASRHLMGVVMGAVLVALLVSAAVVRTPWMPLERIELHGQGKALTGYVLEAEPGFLKVMTEKDRHFVILNDGAVKSREELIEH
ncbi:hypothetical protein [Streptomyces sp. NPDC051561]|uniref:hypothetical protein n=1 Tax=Streptomyces sp. NPDC051561 TaxID=3365658 RepID=UPI00378E6815